MKELRSFKDAIENSFYPQIEAALSAYITDNADRLDIRSNIVEDVDKAELCDLTIKRAATNLLELISQHEATLGNGNRLAVMEGILFEFVDLSRVAAKIRMLDLGYMDVEGVATYVDDHYISSYAFAADSKNRDQTFSISLSDSLFECVANEKFRDLINSGNFT
jgi:hypothetical protein